MCLLLLLSTSHNVNLALSKNDMEFLVVEPVWSPQLFYSSKMRHLGLSLSNTLTVEIKVENRSSIAPSLYFLLHKKKNLITSYRSWLPLISRGNERWRGGGAFITSFCLTQCLRWYRLVDGFGFRSNMYISTRVVHGLGHGLGHGHSFQFIHGHGRIRTSALAFLLTKCK